MSRPQVAIIDLGIGNLQSVKRALEEVGAEVVLTSQISILASAQRILLPGVGAYGAAISQLNERNIAQIIRKKTSEGVPLLGICLGMQLLFETSEEFGSHEGLGLMQGRVVPLPSKNNNGELLKAPHMNWSSLKIPQSCNSSDSFLFSGVGESSFYFAHSYYVSPTSEDHVVANIDYGDYLIPAVVRFKNIFGCQFHPEKSGPAGLNFLKNFLRL
jgi:glutamine amidotransferase